MGTRARKIPPALKHGAYTTIDVLPGEDPAEFAKLHQDVIAELVPNGAIEEDIVATIARLIWRKQNLATLRMPKLAEKQSLADCLKAFKKSRDEYYGTGSETEEDSEDATKVAQRREYEELAFAQKIWERNLQATNDLHRNGEAAIYDSLNKDLEIEDRFGVMIDKCFKRLLFLRGLKSISRPTSSANSAPQRKLAGGSSKAA